MRILRWLRVRAQGGFLMFVEGRSYEVRPSRMGRGAWLVNGRVCYTIPPSCYQLSFVQLSAGHKNQWSKEATKRAIRHAIFAYPESMHEFRCGTELRSRAR